VVVVGGLVGGVVVGGTVVGGAVVGMAVVGVVVGEGDVAGVDLVTDGTVVADEVELLPALVVDGEVVVGLVLVPALVLVPVLVPVPAPPVEVALDAGVTADDFPSDSTANHSFSTPCPVSWPFFVSLTKWYSA
jgi:hypothetical protein